jgi:hypothetical protein
MNINKNLEKVITLIGKAPIKKLQDREFVIDLICKFGLVPEARKPYGIFNKYMVDAREIAAIYQQPDQLAAALVMLSKFPIESYLEVGTWTGGTYLFIREYLKRFGLKRSLCIDVTPFYLPQQIKPLLPEFAIATSYNVVGDWDLVHIDADHEYQAVKLDYNHLKNRSKIIMFHDVNDSTCPGPGQLWNEIKAAAESGYTCTEITSHTHDLPIHGIGIVFNNDKND